METFSSMATFFRSGGPFMFVIMGTAVLIVAITVERLWVIGRAASLNPIDALRYE